MKRIIIASLLGVFLSFSNSLYAKKEQPIFFTIDMTGPSTDTFLVTAEVKNLAPENNIFQFASAAPGNYSISDIGRFVDDFKAFDKKGNIVETKQIGTNQFEISKPENVTKITYKIAETWDTPVDNNKIWRMSGTSFEKDHALLNVHCIIGFFKGKQEQDIKLKLEHPKDWKVGTPLKKDKKGYYDSPDFDYSVDSPILLGRLTNATLDLEGSKVEIYSYSKTDLIKATDLLSNMDTMLRAATAFLGKLPVDRYVFLFHFEDVTNGAWEHSYSSTYIFKEAPLTPELVDQIVSIAAHEFFHVVTPLNIHSEIIENFNFATPTASEHLWLYEGTTEWASDIMQLRHGIMDLQDFLGQLYEKLNVDDKLDKEYSLSKISLTSYTPDGQKQYYNVYNRGAIVSTLLDIRLLELSGGKRGLRELILDLADTYGPNKSFPEKELFDIIVKKSYPEIEDFINNYIRNAEPLPLEEYFSKIGISYFPEVKTGNTVPNLGFDISVSGDGLMLVQVDSALQAQGLQDGDVPVLMDDVRFDMENIEAIQKKVLSLKIGDTFSITAESNGQKIVGKTVLKGEEQVYKHFFQPDPEATTEQLALREIWMSNLPLESKSKK